MNCSTPGLPVHHQLPEFTQTQVHRVSDAIQPSHPLSSPCPPAPSPSQHQGLFQWASPSLEVAKVLKFQLQHQSFQWTPRTDLLYNGLFGSLCSPRDSRVFSNTTVQKHLNIFVLLESQRRWDIDTEKLKRNNYWKCPRTEVRNLQIKEAELTKKKCVNSNPCPVIIKITKNQR